MVTFNNKVFGEFLFTDVNLRNSTTYSYSTVKSVRDALESQMSPPSISAIGLDFNKDDIIDQWNISLRIRKAYQDLALT